jgi:hypothetical protein
MNTIFGYAWSDIQRAQQGGRLSAMAPKEYTASVQCFGCHKFFRLPQTMGTNPWPVQCKHCGHIHTENDGLAAMWPRWGDNGKWQPVAD